MKRPIGIAAAFLVLSLVACSSVNVSSGQPGNQYDAAGYCSYERTREVRLAFHWDREWYQVVNVMVAIADISSENATIHMRPDHYEHAVSGEIRQLELFLDNEDMQPWTSIMDAPGDGGSGRYYEFDLPPDKDWIQVGVADETGVYNSAIFRLDRLSESDELSGSLLPCQAGPEWPSRPVRCTGNVDPISCVQYRIPPYLEPYTSSADKGSRLGHSGGSSRDDQNLDPGRIPDPLPPEPDDRDDRRPCIRDCMDMDGDGRTWNDYDADGDGLYEPR